jgi:hypothetical protein
MSSHNVILEKDSERININQAPGLPYSVSPNDLGGEKVYVVKKANGTIVKTFEGDEVIDLRSI